MGALPKKGDASLSLLILADDPAIGSLLQGGLTDPAISLIAVSILDHIHLLRTARHADILIFYVGDFSFEKAMPTLKIVRKQYAGVKIYVIDGDATPQRAVTAMKAGACDYFPHTGTRADLISLVKKSCLNTPLTPSFPDAFLPEKNRNNPSQSLPGKIQTLAKAAEFLAASNNLQDVCEGLLMSLGEALGATGGSLYLKDGEQLQRVHTLDPGHAPQRIPLPLKKGSIFEQVYASGDPVLLTGAEEIRRHNVSGWSGYEANNLFVYPLVEKNGEPIGILSLHGKREQNFTEEDQDLVMILAFSSHETIRALLAQEKSTKLFDSLRLTFDNMSQGILLLNEVGEIVHFNRKFLSIVRLTEKQIAAGHNIAEILDIFRERGDLGGDAGETSIWKLLNADHEYLLHCKSGVMITVVGSQIPEGGSVLTFTDTTRQKEWEKQLSQAKEKAEAASISKTSFLANVSHELRTPLNAIIGFAEMIHKEVYGPLLNPKYGEYVKHIHDSGSHLLRLINNLLDLSKVEAGKFESHMSDVHVSELTENTLMYFSGQASDSGINLVHKEKTDIGTIRTDENALRQILLNLLSNALKFTPRGGEVALLTDLTEKGELHIMVRDNGIGMAENSLELALQPFGQIENTFNRKYPGTGLGLPLVVSLVKLLDGRFDIESALGDGTSCSIYIPVEKNDGLDSA